MNCFIRCIIDHFQNKMTQSGSGLTPKRQQILAQFDEKLAGIGCSKDDMFDLETALVVRLLAVDALGNILWDSGKHNTHMKVVVPCHNKHAWADLPSDQLKVTKVHLLDEQPETVLAKLSTRRVKTTAAQKTLDQKTREILVAFAARIIPPTTRLWLSGQSLV